MKTMTLIARVIVSLAGKIAKQRRWNKGIVAASHVSIDEIHHLRVFTHR